MPAISTIVLHRIKVGKVEPVLGSVRGPPPPLPIAVVVGAESAGTDVVVVPGSVVLGAVVVVIVVVVTTGHATQVMEADAVWVK